jgi:hypothetical protein
MSRFVRSEITTQLVAYLAAFDKGSHVDYGKLSERAATPISARSGHLRSARHILQHEHNQVWDAVAPGVGVYRLNDAQIAAHLARWWIPGARRKLRRGGDQASIVRLDQLTVDQQARLATDTIQVELASQALSKATANRLNKVARGTSNDLPSFNAIEWAITLMPRRAS